jgi:hypothetical protein
MSTHALGRPGLCLALFTCVLPLLFAPADAAAPAAKTQHYKGKVVPLAPLVEKIGSRLDRDAAPFWVGLVTDDGTIYPLIKDDRSRLFFQDTRLQNRPMRLTGRVLPGSHLLQVLEVHSYVKGQRCEVYYWCDVCAIKRFEKQACDCCGGPMELREVPVKEK